MSSQSHAPLSSLVPPATREISHSLLALEKSLQQVGEGLLEVYSQRKHWLAVKQLAQALADNSERIETLSEWLPVVGNPEGTEELEERALDLGEVLLEMTTSVRRTSSAQVSVEDFETEDGSVCFHIVASIPGAKPVTHSQEDVAMLHINLLEKHYRTALALHKSMPVTVGELQRFLNTALSEPSIQNDAALVTFLTKGGDKPVLNGGQRSPSQASSGTVESDFHASPSPSPVHHKSPTPIGSTPPTITNAASPAATSPVPPSATSPVLSLTTNSSNYQSAASPVSSTENSLLGDIRTEEGSNSASDRPASPSGLLAEALPSAEEVVRAMPSIVPTSSDPSEEDSNPLSCDTSSSSLPASSIAATASASSVGDSQGEPSPEHVAPLGQVPPTSTDASASTSAVSLDTDEMDDSRRSNVITTESLPSTDITSTSSHEQDMLLSPPSEPSIMARESSPSLSESSQLTDKSDGVALQPHPASHSSQTPAVSATNSEPESSSDVLAPLSEHSSVSSPSTVKQRPARRSPSAKLSSSIKLPKLGRSKTLKDDSLEQGVESTVSLAARQLTTEWDPTCILEELYNDCRPIVHSSSTGENCRHSGYLDKLPVNQKKPNVMKGWKTRFFRLTRGSLFYYDDENATKATSFIRLADAKIVVDPDSLKIQIFEKGSGNYILLRAENKDDLATWQKCLQLEAVHPTMTHRLSLSPTHDVPTLIMDLGSCSVRAGIASDNTYPQLFFPTVCAIDVDSSQVVATGLKALSPEIRSQTQLVYPLRARARMDTLETQRFLCLRGIIDSVLADVHIQPQSSNILVSISPAMSDSDREDLARLLLEDFCFHGILIQEQTVLALYSYNCTTGIVVSVGDTIDVVPIIDGFKVEAGSSHIPLGGSSVTESLSKLASAMDIRYFSGTETFIMRFVKESICFLSQNYGEDVAKCDESPAAYARAVDVDRFQLPDHKKVVHLDSALFKAPEGLFCPGLWGKDIPAIHELVFKAVEQAPIDMRKDLCRGIYLSGGTSLLVGFPERLELELQQLMPRADIQVQASDTRQHAAYLGAATLASLSSFRNSLVTMEDWNADGMKALRGKN